MDSSCICCGNERTAKDCFEQCYSFRRLVANEIKVLWEAEELVGSCGTVVIDVILYTGGTALDIIINDVEIAPFLFEGDSLIITTSVLNKIAISPKDDSVDVIVNLYVNVNYECC